MKVQWKQVCLAILLGLPAAGCVTVKGGDAPLIIEDRRLVVEANINGEGPFRLLLDSNCYATTIRPEVVTQLKLEAKRMPGGALRIDKLEVGTAVVPSVFITVASLGDPPDVSGILCRDFLKEFRMTLDYRQKHVTFEEP